MSTVVIKGFGPVKEATVDLDKNFQVFIGVQASGKSTICRIVYFCQKIRDYTLDFLMEEEQFTQNNYKEYFNNYMKYLVKQFMGCFGKTVHMKRFHIEYHFGNDQFIKIHLNTDGFVRYTFSYELRNGISALIDNAAEMYLKGFDNNNKFSSIIDNLNAMALMKKQLSQALEDLFDNPREILYIPAGRSLLATMSEQLQDYSISDMDLTMQEFINLIRVTKSRFGSKIPDIVKDYTKTVKGQVNNVSLDLAYALIRNILKADYTSNGEGEKIYFDERHWVKLMYGSSGQQEALWILMLCFIKILEKKKSFVVIEEPEAHLFPIAQKDMVNLIALMVNTTGSNVILTTHSPHILTSLNILLYSDKVEGESRKGKDAVIPKSLRLSYDTFAAFVTENSPQFNESIFSLMDDESHLIRTDYIDSVSDVTNDELEKLLDKEAAEL